MTDPSTLLQDALNAVNAAATAIQAVIDAPSDSPPVPVGTPPADQSGNQQTTPPAAPGDAGATPPAAPAGDDEAAEDEVAGAPPVPPVPPAASAEGQ